MADVLFCRLCALKKDKLVGIYDEEGHKLSIKTKINKCLHFEIYQTDSLPKYVCLDCCFKLEQFSMFVDCSANAQNTLLRIFQDDAHHKSLEDAQTTIELAALNCDSRFQVVKDYGSNQEIQQVAEDHQQTMYQTNQEHMHGEEGEEDYEEEDEEEMCEEEEVEELEEDGRFDDGLVTDNVNLKSGVMNNGATIDNTSGYVECLVPQKDGDG
ncbi:hypothetical protein LSTR_LSTR015002, partial [Laodelphax striatellus]